MAEESKGGEEGISGGSGGGDGDGNSVVCGLFFRRLISLFLSRARHLTLITESLRL